MTTTTESPAGVPASVAQEQASVVPASQLERLLGTADHKVVGRLYVVFALLFGAASLVVIALTEAELISDGDLLGSSYEQLANTSLLGLIFLGVLPATLGLGLYLTPLQVGSPTVAFPRAAAGSFWLWAMSSVLFIVGVAADGGYGFDADAEMATLTNVALGGVIVALLLGAVSMVTTVITLRRWGMSLERVPLFSFSLMVAGTLWIFTLPVALGSIVTGQVTHLLPVELTSETFGEGLAWLLHHPAVYVLAIPVLGAVGDIVPVFARSRTPRYTILLGAIVAFGALSFGVWAQPFVDDETTLRDNHLWSAFGIVILLPLLAFAGGIADTLRRGRPRVGAPLALALVALVLLLLAVLDGALFSLEFLDVEARQAMTSQLYLVSASALAAVTAGIWYWHTKLVGPAAAEGAGFGASLLLLGGGALWGLPYAIGSLIDRDGGSGSPEELFAVLTTIGACLVALALLASVGGIAAAARKASTSAGPVDPWDGHTLEWVAPSPPPEGNFIADLPPVLSERPLLDLAQESR